MPTLPPVTLTTEALPWAWHSFSALCHAHDTHPLAFKVWQKSQQAKQREGRTASGTGGNGKGKSETKTRCRRMGSGGGGVVVGGCRWVVMVDVQQSVVGDGW